MRTITTETKVYFFEELSPSAKGVALSDYIDFRLETYNHEWESDNFQRAVQEAETMQTPWFVGEYVYDYCKEELMEELVFNKDEFTEDGRCSRYTPKGKQLYNT